MIEATGMAGLESEIKDDDSHVEANPQGTSQTPDATAGTNSVPSSETTPQIEKQLKSSYDQLWALVDDPNFTFKDEEILGDLLVMEKFKVIPDGDRVLALVGMTAAELSEQREYQLMQAHVLEEEKRRTLGPEQVEKLGEDVEMLKTKYQGKTTEKALAQMEIDDAEMFSEEAIASASADLEKVSAEDREEIKKKMKLEAKLKAKLKRAKFIAELGIKFNGFIESSVAESNFSEFMDNFFSQAVSRGRGAARYAHEFPNGDGEMISNGEVMDLFRSKKKLVKTLNHFFEGIHDIPAYSHIEKPSELKDAEEYKDIKPEQLQKIMVRLATLLEKDILNSESPVMKKFEESILESLGKKEPYKAMVNDQVFTTFIQMGNPDRPAMFKHFVKKFTDVEQRTETAEEPEAKSESEAVPAAS